MTFEEIANKFEDLRVQSLKVPPGNFGNYKVVISEYKHILNDMIVLCRNLAQNLTPADEPKLPSAGSFS